MGSRKPGFRKPRIGFMVGLLIFSACGCRQQQAVITLHKRALSSEIQPGVERFDETTTTAPATLRVAAWNIEHLGSPNSRRDVGHGVAQDIGKLADAIEEAGVDIVALAEIYTDDRREDGTWTSAELDALVANLNSRLAGGSLYSWDYLLFDNAVRNDTSQVCGALWNWNVIDGVTWWAVPVEGGRRNGSRLWDRRPHAVQFSAGPDRTDFVVIPLHMKASRNFKEHRGVEAGQLVDKLDLLRTTFADRDVVLIGDTNCAAASEQAVTAFTSAGFDDLNGGMVATVPWGTPLDRAFVANDAADNQEFDGGFVVFAGDDMNPALSASDFRRLCSDHFMVYTTISIMEDDDH